MDFYCPKSVTDAAFALTSDMWALMNDAAWDSYSNEQQVKEWNTLSALLYDYDVAMRKVARVAAPARRFKAEPVPPVTTLTLPANEH